MPPRTRQPAMAARPQLRAGCRGGLSPQCGVRSLGVRRPAPHERLLETDQSETGSTAEDAHRRCRRRSPMWSRSCTHCPAPTRRLCRPGRSPAQKAWYCSANCWEASAGRRHAAETQYLTDWQTESDKTRSHTLAYAGFRCITSARTLTSNSCLKEKSGASPCSRKVQGMSTLRQPVAPLSRAHGG